MNQKQIGEFISKNRKIKKLTQRELAEKLGVTEKSVSNWENGRNMPDISLFNPLCQELNITINELLSGEKIKQENYQNKLEENIINALNYTDNKINKSYNIISIILLIFGVLIIITAVTIFPSESSWSSIYSVFGLIITLIGFAKLIRKLSYPKRVIFNYLFITASMAFLLFIDFINVKLNDQAPMFSISTITIDKTILYDTPFYDVYRCNTNLDNEYWVIEKNENYDAETIMKYCK